MKTIENKQLNTSMTSTTLVAPMQLSVKNVDNDVFREFKAASVKEGFTVGNALTLAMRLWIERRKKKFKMSLLDIKIGNWGEGTEKTSEKIDDVLYEKWQ